MIEFVAVEKTYPAPRAGEADVVAVEGLDLAIAAGETHCLIGTSGCGKTTTLRMVNRLEEPSRGQVRVAGVDVARQDAIVLRRSIGYVIQHGGLFPHMTVARNVGLLCELESWPKAKATGRVRDLLSLVRLPPEEFAHRYPGELSGGQRQRVGVARALALDPDTVLMDEPFGALDPITRQEVQAEFVDLLRAVKKTVLMVTHDLSEAFALADRVTLMHEGRVVQTGTEAELLQQPADAFVRDFLRSHGGGRHA